MQLPTIDSLALFADFDGTLVDIAPTPDAIVVDSHLKTLLNRITDSTGKAFAIVTGRSLENIGQHLTECPCPVAANHGGQWQFPGEETQHIPLDDNQLSAYQSAISQFAQQNALIFEMKPLGIAVHFRQHPECEAALDNFLASLEISANYKVIQGKAVRELKPALANKGNAIERFMKMPPFKGKTPVFFGDDITDEDGFRFVNRAGGFSFKVGDGETSARHRLADPAQVKSFLTELIEQNSQ